MDKLRIVFKGLLYAVLLLKSYAEPVVLKGNNVPAYVDQLPALAATPQEAYTTCFPKGKKTTGRQIEEELKLMIIELADRSNHHSRLLSMIAGRYEKESAQYDFSKLKITKDKSLEQAFNDFNTAFLNEMENYRSSVSQSLESIRAGNVTGITYAGKELAVYREKIPALFTTAKNLLTRLDSYINKKKLNTVLDSFDTTHPNYIQLLEVRGMMLYRVLQLNQLAEGANQSAATMVDTCKKNPAACQ